MRFWANLIGYQIVWLCVVASAAQGRAGWGIACALAFVVAQWRASDARAADMRLVACAVVLGLGLDGALAGSGWLRYASPEPLLLPAPVWILALWAAFAMTLNHSLAPLREHPAWSCLLGAFGGPLAYYGAARGFGAVEFIAPAWRATVALTLGWALAMPLLAALAQRWHRAARATPLPEASR